MFLNWTLGELEKRKNRNYLLIRDPLQLLPKVDNQIDDFANINGYTVIESSTNLHFRTLYEAFASDQNRNKLIIIDRTPMSRKNKSTSSKAPPIIYPDLFVKLNPGIDIIELDIQQRLMEITNDPNWPVQVNDPVYSRIIKNNYDAVLRAYENLRNSDNARFTDKDLETIITYSALGIPEAAFYFNQQQDYWKIALLGGDEITELQRDFPRITKNIITELRKAPSPFNWFAIDVSSAMQCFYLSLLLAQHHERWDLLVRSICGAARQFPKTDTETIFQAAEKLIDERENLFHSKLKSVEENFSREELQTILIDELKIDQAGPQTTFIEKEKYSNLFRSLALLLALDTALGGLMDDNQKARVLRKLEGSSKDAVDKYSNVCWNMLKETFLDVSKIQTILKDLKTGIRELELKKSEQRKLIDFLNIWNTKQVKRLEYYASTLKRNVESNDLLPKDKVDLPEVFVSALTSIREKTLILNDDVIDCLNKLNSLFQPFVVANYSSWSEGSDEIVLTPHFITRCLKPNWDPQTEKAVIMIFDGLRLDIWEELIRPMFEERLEHITTSYNGASLLPSETVFSRKAISAGSFPESFDKGLSEDKLLEESLEKAYSRTFPIEVSNVRGTGEIVRYKTQNLDVYIFEICDRELHGIRYKRVRSNRIEPERPLTFLYLQHIKDIIDREVMQIVRSIEPNTKVFIVADHGFGRIGTKRITIESDWVNDTNDIHYQFACLSRSLAEIKASDQVINNVFELPITSVKLKRTEFIRERNTGSAKEKTYSTIIFPKVGFALARPEKNFTPDAYSHGGITLEEMLIPMFVFRSRHREDRLIQIDEVSGSNVIVEGQEQKPEYSITIRNISSAEEEFRVDVQASYSIGADYYYMPSRSRFLTAKSEDMITFSIELDTTNIGEEERRRGKLECRITISITYTYHGKSFIRSRYKDFIIHLNSEKLIRRAPTSLGSILGLKPKGMS